MTALWYLVVDGHVTRTCRADTMTAARAAFAPVADHAYVTSAASHALGMPRPLAAGRCLGCGIREKESNAGRCRSCDNTIRREMMSEARAGAPRSATPHPRPARAVAKARHDRKPDRRAAKTAWQAAARAAERAP